MDKTLLRSLILDLRQFLTAALEKDDFASLKRYAAYLEALVADEKPTPLKVEEPVGNPRPQEIPSVAPSKPGGENLKADKPKKGRILTATFKNVTHQVKILKNGVEYEGKVYKSLNQAVDVFAGKGQGKRLRLFASWEVTGEKEGPGSLSGQGPVGDPKPQKVPSAASGKPKPVPRISRRQPEGQVLTSTYKDMTYQIKILKKGVEHDGRVYSSLNQAVDAIVGKGSGKKLRSFAFWKPLGE